MLNHLLFSSQDHLYHHLWTSSPINATLCDICESPTFEWVCRNGPWRGSSSLSRRRRLRHPSLRHPRDRDATRPLLQLDLQRLAVQQRRLPRRRYSNHWVPAQPRRRLSLGVRPVLRPRAYTDGYLRGAVPVLGRVPEPAHAPARPEPSLPTDRQQHASSEARQLRRRTSQVRGGNHRCGCRVRMSTTIRFVIQIFWYKSKMNSVLLSFTYLFYISCSKCVSISKLLCKHCIMLLMYRSPQYFVTTIGISKWLCMVTEDTCVVVYAWVCYK